MNNGPRILFVDDDRDLLETISIFLESKGYQVTTAHDAVQGLVKARAQRPDLILLDVMIPEGTEGFHFVWNLRQEQDESLRNTPILILTAIHEKTVLRFYPDSSDGTYQAGEYLPVQDFMEKPVDPVQLLERIHKVLTALHKE
jgi:two-component system alkaline phosphatase synthesis response regulator PhoP